MLHLLKLAQIGVRTREDIYTEFKSLVNMSATELEIWLETQTAKCPIEPELVVDIKISRKLVKILRKRKVMLTEGEYAFMDRLISHLHKLYNFKPTESLPDSMWRYALMNLGHDPAKVLEN